MGCLKLNNQLWKVLRVTKSNLSPTKTSRLRVVCSLGLPGRPGAFLVVLRSNSFNISVFSG